VILLVAIAAGLLAGFVWAGRQGHPYRPPELHHLWLAPLAFLPQLATIYLPSTREHIPDWLAAASFLTSQALLLTFALLNWRLPGMPILIFGAILNLLVVASNGGFMPISPHTASQLVSQEIIQNIPTGSRFGTKDILLSPQETHLEWLADRFLTPPGFHYRVAFSLGDVLIAIGAFWLLAYQGVPILNHLNKGN